MNSAYIHAPSYSNEILPNSSFIWHSPVFSNTVILLRFIFISEPSGVFDSLLIQAAQSAATSRPCARIMLQTLNSFRRLLVFNYTYASLKKIVFSYIMYYVLQVKPRKNICLWSCYFSWVFRCVLLCVGYIASFPQSRERVNCGAFS